MLTAPHPYITPCYPCVKMPQTGFGSLPADDIGGGTATPRRRGGDGGRSGSACSDPENLEYLADAFP